jgi:hypothetical protein
MWCQRQFSSCRRRGVTRGAWPAQAGKRAPGSRLGAMLTSLATARHLHVQVPGQREAGQKEAAAARRQPGQEVSGVAEEAESSQGSANFGADNGHSEPLVSASSSAVPPAFLTGQGLPYGTARPVVCSAVVCPSDRIQWELDGTLFRVWGVTFQDTLWGVAFMTVLLTVSVLTGGCYHMLLLLPGLQTPFAQLSAASLDGSEAGATEGDAPDSDAPSDEADDFEASAPGAEARAPAQYNTHQNSFRPPDASELHSCVQPAPERTPPVQPQNSLFCAYRACGSLTPAGLACLPPLKAGPNPIVEWQTCEDCCACVLAGGLGAAGGPPAGRAARHDARRGRRARGRRARGLPAAAGRRGAQAACATHASAHYPGCVMHLCAPYILA